ncbi:5-formyltetrahydrofolate cyclo-ligase [Enhygromyxa salina]|uniref:5-formyltetrahydrofolate cyclo-ligase n=1 Tax=Enhygromyxa salina TaxID=215803 RepID=UPI0015E5B038|nr:5-formyltetrahydrofolate cyclo-ligase [Enhygromyxa salina]
MTDARSHYVPGQDRKQSLRAELLGLRRSMPRAQLEIVSGALTRELAEHPLWLGARGIAAFVGVRGEVDTRPLLERCLGAGKSVWLPRLTGPGRMRFWPCVDLDRLERGAMGLLEPPIHGPGELAPGPERGVDLILVPGLGFGRDGARLGFGAGHYDRALATRHGDPSLTMPTLCGVCPVAFVDPPGGPIPMLGHDLAMDYLATDAGVERCVARPGA